MSYLKKGFGENVKFIRKSRNLTQEKLAELINIDQRQLARIEAGESFVTAETIEKICENLSVTVKDLFNIENNENLTFDVINIKNNNFKKLNNILKKSALNNEKTEYLILAFDALEKRIAREKLKGYLLGLDLK